MKEIILESLRRELLTRTSLDNFPESIWKRAGALNTWGTNAIEGNTLTWHDVERLLLEDKSVANRPVRDVIETIQHEAAFRGLIGRRTKPITIQTVLELHEAVFRGVKDDAGHWRRINVRITGSKHSPPRVEKVVLEMERWAREYESRDRVGEDMFALAGWAHFMFESIHPFSDGNGRAGRLLLNLHFLKHNWPPINILPPDRDQYIRYLRLAEDGDTKPLENFFRTLMASSLLDLLDKVGTKKDELKQLKDLSRFARHSSQYLSLRAGHGELPALMVKGDWMTSKRAVELYGEHVGRTPRKDH